MLRQRKFNNLKKILKNIKLGTNVVRVILTLKRTFSFSSIPTTLKIIGINNWEILSWILYSVVAFIFQFMCQKWKKIL